MSSSYDPFARGALGVGVRTAQLVDRQRANRPLPMEVWYPADAPHVLQAAVRDAAVLAGRYPLILFSHTSNGHRRQSTFLCTHLASHGYVVAGVDHTGNTAMDAAGGPRPAGPSPPRNAMPISTGSLLTGYRTSVFCWTSSSRVVRARSPGRWTRTASG